MQQVHNITLSYTFFNTGDEKEAELAAAQATAAVKSST